MLVAAAGNERLNGNYAVRPASDPHVLAVAATDGVTPAEFSNEGTATDVSAPGVNMLTTTSLFPNAHAFVAGTSFSSPMVAAAALWIRAERPGLTADQIADVIRDSAVDIFSGGWDTRTGFGMLNVQRALAQQERAARPARAQRRHRLGRRLDHRARARRVLEVEEEAEPDAAARRGSTPFKDQVDVYRARLRPKSKFTAKLRASTGNPDLELWSAEGGHGAAGATAAWSISRARRARRGPTPSPSGTRARSAARSSWWPTSMPPSKTRTADYVLKLK